MGPNPSHRRAAIVLIVPAVFCADAEQMRVPKKQAASFERHLTIHWKPGLGEDLYLLFK